MEKSFDIRPPQGSRLKEKPEPKTDQEKASLRGLELRFPSLPILPPWGKLGLLALIPLLLFLAFLHFNVSVEIEIWPKREKQAVVVEVKISALASEPNFGQKILPGFVFDREREASQEFSSLGTSETSERASGTVRAYNNYQLPQTLVETTRFLSAEGKLFRSTKGVIIPVGGSEEVPVIAAEPGPSYNIGPTTFSIPGLVGSPRYSQVYAKSFAPIGGGSEGKTAQVSKADLDRALTELRNKLSSELRQELEEISGEALTLITSGIEEEVLKTSSSQEAGAAAERFTFNLGMRARGLSFRNSDLETLGEKLILAELEEGTKIWPEGFKLDWSLEKIDWKRKEALLRLEAGAETYSELDLESLKKAFLGKSLDATRTLLSSYPEIEKSQIHLWPFWRSSLPDDLEKVETSIRFDR